MVSACGIQHVETSYVVRSSQNWVTDRLILIETFVKLLTFVFVNAWTQLLVNVIT